MEWRWNRRSQACINSSISWWWRHGDGVRHEIAQNSTLFISTFWLKQMRGHGSSNCLANFNGITVVISTIVHGHDNIPIVQVHINFGDHIPNRFSVLMKNMLIVFIYDYRRLILSARCDVMTDIMDMKIIFHKQFAYYLFISYVKLKLCWILKK